MPNMLSPRDLVFRPDNMDETVPHIFFHLIKHAKKKQLKLVLDFTCNNIFTQQFGTITVITLNIFKRLSMIFYAALWL